MAAADTAAPCSWAGAIARSRSPRPVSSSARSPANGQPGPARRPCPRARPPRNPCTLPPATCAPPPATCHPPPAVRAPLEGNTAKDNTRKEGSRKRRKTARRTRTTLTLTASTRSTEIGLTNRQVWAATLGELARRGDVGRAELESWLRPAALIGRDGPDADPRRAERGHPGPHRDASPAGRARGARRHDRGAGRGRSRGDGVMGDGVIRSLRSR